MGKKKDKKGKGAEKTHLKELKNSEKRLKKELGQTGEEAIDKVISQHAAENKNITKTVETKCGPPSERCNMSLNAHHEKDLLIMFGGEFFNGKQTIMYNDLFVYHIKSKEWSQIVSPNSPVPRCSHQAVVLAQGGGQLWMFGGEYASSSQSQFFHFNDLWVFHLSEKKWEKIDAPGGPSPRSGHRMVSCKKMLFVFGGFCDNSVSYKYFNDVHAFSVESRVWLKLQLTGLPPSPRSGCVMAVTQDQNNIMVYGGYSKEKVKKDVDKGFTHGDMFMLSVNSSKTKSDADCQPLTWKWSTIKQYGHLPQLRCSTSLVVTSNNRAVMFGGIRDEDEDEDSVEGSCLNDMYLLEVDKGRWHPLAMRMPNENITKKRRRAVKDANESESENEDEMELSNLDITAKRSKVADDEARESDDRVVVKNSEEVAKSSGQECSNQEKSIFTPSPRMRPMMAAKRGLLYIYGGCYEDGNRQIILSDFYSIDLQKMNEWNVLIPQKEISMDWEESDDEDSSEDGESDSSDEESSEDDEESEESDEDDDPTRSGPRKKSEETFKEYFDRTFPTWKSKSLKVAEKEGISATPRQVDKAAKKMAQEYWDKISFSKK